MRAPGNDASIGGLKVVAESGWFLYHYLRIIVTMFAIAQVHRTAPALHTLISRRGVNAVLVTLTVVLFWLGTYPASLIHVIQVTAVDLV